MATIGTFKPTATGFEGTIATLMTNKKVRFVANEKKKTENSPDYFVKSCLLYTSPSPRDATLSRMPSSA